MVSKRLLRTGALVLVAMLAGAAGYYFHRGTQAAAQRQAAVETLLLKPLKTLDGKAQSLAQWRGKVLVVNLWATWCEPCRQEIPALMRLSKKYSSKNVQFVGIGIDQVDKIAEYASSMGIDYTLLVGGAESLAVSAKLGNHAGVLPYTVVVGGDGALAYTHAGAVTEAAMEEVLRGLLTAS